MFFWSKELGFIYFKNFFRFYFVTLCFYGYVGYVDYDDYGGYIYYIDYIIYKGSYGGGERQYFWELDLLTFASLGKYYFLRIFSISSFFIFIFCSNTFFLINVKLFLNYFFFINFLNSITYLLEAFVL